MKKDIQTFSFRRKWLSDGIGDSYKTWYNKDEAREATQYKFSTQNIILIKSPTGTGKTTFILNNLVSYAEEKERNILYFGNRTALNAQLQLEAKKQLFEVKFKSNRESGEYIYNNSDKRLTILNYQSCDKYTDEYLIGLNPYYVIFDEAHYFVDDALFNKKTYYNFRKLLRLYSDSALIFMTATPVDFEQLFNILVPKGINTHLQPQIYESISRENILIYENTYSAARNYQLLAYQKKKK